MKTADIRQQFLQFFAGHGHQIVPSSSLVPGNDPTLLFTNAGMVPFKDAFLGAEALSYSRATSCQRCVRAGGKHNDLENVGYTARHHTFFEMLGNFSFGDYFKREAIAFAWEFLTQILALPPEKLWVTVYEEDDEAADIWLKEMKIDPQRFSRCGQQDNFWSMGETGPCGPCSEIFYDHGPSIAGGPPGSEDADGDRYVEIWNLVFMQYNRDARGELTPLPKPSVDTGMGLERVAAVMQGVHSNYDIDLFQHLIKAIADIADTRDLTSNSLKVIADHIRSCCFLIADGVTPGNEGRAYVLRRIIRRAIRHGHKLGITQNFFAALVAPLIDLMGEAYPELAVAQAHIEQVLDQEETQFARTLDQGLKILEQDIDSARDSNIIHGDVVFKLYDTYGFPVDLTRDIARERGLLIDIAGFEEAMAKQRQQSQAASAFGDYQAMPQHDQTTTFIGYDTCEQQAEVTALFRDGEAVTSLQAGEQGAVILAHTPFYAESGGQVGDRGLLLNDQMTFEVTDSQKSGAAHIHLGQLRSGQLQVGDEVTAQVDVATRQATMLNHSATHLLHAALRRILGEHVVQKGSLVAPDRLRFDFAHPQPLSLAQLDEIETLVNAQIRLNTPVSTAVMTAEEAKQAGALALFGEKYGDSVRVLSMGDFSKELCGGTHVRRTGDIGFFKIIGETGIAAGVRRIEALTGQAALDWVGQLTLLVGQLSDMLKTKPDQLQPKLTQLIEQQRQLQKQYTALQNQLAMQAGDDLLKQAVRIKDITVLATEVTQVEAKALRELLDRLRDQLEPAVIVLVASQDDKINVVAGVSKSIVGQVPPARDYVTAICGRGGGRADMAQGGGAKPADLAEKLVNIGKMIENYASNQ
jgi:alanyl-tRNA synthetase